MKKEQSSNLFFDIFNKNNKPEYIKDKNGRRYLTYFQNGVYKTVPENSEQIKHLIISIFKEHKLGHINRNLIESITDQIKSNAFSSDIIREVFTRYGIDENKSVVIDLGVSGYCIVSTNGFEVVKSVSIPFHKPQKMLSLPIPNQVDLNLFLKKFKSKFNFENEDNYLLVLAFILKSFVPLGANPIFVIQGLQGSGKTTASKIIKKLIDPSHPLLFAPPNNILDIIVTANSSYLLAFDNISGINAEMADFYCRISTGIGFTKRALYTDDEEKSYDLSRPTLINGIDELTTRADFLDRAIIINLAKISTEQRKSESKLDEELVADYPILFSGIVSLLSPILKILPNIQDSNLPRMTEFARFGIALEKVLGLDDGIFLKTYDKNSSDKSDVAFWNDEICIAIYNRLVPREVSEYSTNDKVIKGTISFIRDSLAKTEHGSSKTTQLTRTVKGFSGQLKRIEPLLNSKSIYVERLQRSAKKKEILIKMSDDGFNKLIQDSIDQDNEDNLQFL